MPFVLPVVLFVGKCFRSKLLCGFFDDEKPLNLLL